MKKITCILFLLFLFPIKANAIYEVIDPRCTNALKMSLREEAQEVVYRLSRVVDENNISYTAYFYNMTDDMYMTDSSGTMYTNSTLQNLKPGSTLVINIYASSKNYCEGYKISSKIINVPYYNIYFGSELCRGYENYSLCQENVNVNMTEEQFIKKLNDYKKSLEVEKKEEKIDVVEEEEFTLYDFIMDNLYFLIGSLVVIAVAATIIIYINHKKNGGIL